MQRTRWGQYVCMSGVSMLDSDAQPCLVHNAWSTNPSQPWKILVISCINPTSATNLQIFDSISWVCSWNFVETFNRQKLGDFESLLLPLHVHLCSINDPPSLTWTVKRHDCQLFYPSVSHKICCTIWEDLRRCYSWLATSAGSWSTHMDESIAVPKVIRSSAVSSHPSKVLYLAGGYDVDGYSHCLNRTRAVQSLSAQESWRTKQWNHKSTVGQV